MAVFCSPSLNHIHQRQMAAPLHSASLYFTPRRGGTQYTVPKKVQRPREGIGKGADPCTGGKRADERDGR